MKTTIKSFLVAAVAATTLFSCSNEIESFEGVVPGNPGDVQISIGLGGGGATTYSTVTLEKAIKNGSAMLYHKTTKAKIPLQKVRFAEGKFTATILAKDFTPNDEAQLCIYVNDRVAGEIGSSVTDTTTYNLMKAATVSTPLNRELTNGIPASLDAVVTLKAEKPITGELSLKRVAARVGAESANAISIDGYKIELVGVNTASGKLFPSAAASAANPAVTVTHTISGLNTDMFKGQTVGYVYPSTGSSIIVTPPTGKGEPKTVNFAPEANKNYTVKITPKVTQDGTFDNTITIVVWDAGEDINVDMNPERLLAKVVIEPTAEQNFKKYKDGVSVKANYTHALMDIQNLVERQPNGTLGVLNVELVNTFAAADAPTAENPLSIKTSEGGQSTVFGIATFATPRAEVKKTLKVTYAVESGAPYVRYLHIYLEKYETNVEKLLVNIGGNLWMPFNTSGDLATDEATATAILAMASGANNTEKIVAYGYANLAQQYKLIGKFFLGRNIATACPAGYTAATMADWNALAGSSTLPTGTTRWCDALLTEHNTVQQFTNSTLSRVAKTDISGVTVEDKHKRNFYYTFTAKAQLDATAGAILPFIGNGWAYGEGMPTELEALGGTIQWIGGPQIDGKYPRIPVWSNGINYNTGASATDVGNVRCIKIK